MLIARRPCQTVFSSASSRHISFDWLPDTCAYRLLAEGEPLPEWHPLITGDPQSVIDAGISVRDVAVTESDDIDLTEEVIALQPPVYPHDT